MSEQKVMIKDRFSRQADRNYTVMAFFLPFLLLSIGYATRSIFPFGDKHLLTVDLYHQYAPFLAELKSKLLGGEGLFYSFAGGLGVNFYALFAYYLASPLNLLLLLFPAAFLTESIFVLTLLKLSLASLTFNIFLRKTFSRRGPLAVGFSAFYALSAYIIAYGWNIMWLDSIYMAPLLILGMVLLIREGKFWLYTLSLAYILVVNFYMAWFVCLMAALLFIPFLFRFAPENNPALKILISLKTLFFTAVGTALSAVLLWPTYLAMQVTSAANDSFPAAVEKSASLLDYFGQHLLLVEPTVRSGYPNLYAGIFALLLLPIALLNPKLKLRDRIISMGCLLFMVLSFNTNILNFIWHGFHYPNQLPFRNSFVYIFILLTFLYEGLPGIRQMSKEAISLFAFVLIALIIVVEKIGDNEASPYGAILSIIFVLLYTLIFVRLTDLRQYKRPVTLLLLSVMIVEICLSTCAGLYFLDKNEYFGSREGYASGSVPQSIRAAAAQLDEYGAEMEFVRTEVYPSKTSNDSFLYGLKGLTLFASTTPEEPVRFFKELGLFSNGINSYKYDGSNILLDSLFGIRFLILRDKNHWQEHMRSLVLSNEDIEAYENPFALAIAYGASEDLLQFESFSSNPLENQNRLVKAIDPEADSIFTPVELEIDSSYGANLYPYDDGNNIFSFAKDEEDSSSQLNFSFLANEEAVYNLAFDMRGHKIDSGNISIGDQTFAFSAKSTGNAEIGYLEAGETAEIEINLSSNSASEGEIELYAARLDKNAFYGSYNRIRKKQISLDYLKSDAFKGRVELAEDGLLLITIPYDRGWKAFVNGSPQEILTVDSSLMALRLAAGAHEIKLDFTPYGFNNGLAVTLAAIALLIFIGLFQLLLRAIRNRRQAKEKTKEKEEHFSLIIDPAFLPLTKNREEKAEKIPKTQNELEDKDMQEIRFYYCHKCKNLVLMLNNGGGELVCCNEPMELLSAKTQGESDYEHVPSLERTEAGIRARVGFIDHPSTVEHQIEWLVAVQGKRYQIQFLSAGEDPAAEFNFAADPVDVYAYCNQHGLWKGSLA